MNQEAPLPCNNKCSVCVDKCVKYYMEGHCAAFAVALYRLSGSSYPLHCFYVKGQPKVVHHAFCLSSSDTKKVIDAKGVRAIDEIYRDYGVMEGDIKATTVRKLCKEGGNEHFMNNREIEKAKNFIKKFPEKYHVQRSWIEADSNPENQVIKNCPDR